MQYWLFKVEPSDYSWKSMVADKTTAWSGVRNYQAQKYMRTMKIGDLGFYYHTEGIREIVGIVKVCKEFYLKDDPKFGMVDVEYVEPLDNIVTLADIKQNAKLATMTLLRQPRLSVSSVSKEQWKIILEMSKDEDEDENVDDDSESGESDASE